MLADHTYAQFMANNGILGPTDTHAETNVAMFDPETERRTESSFHS
jgi:hypothetical protein